MRMDSNNNQGIFIFLQTNWVLVTMKTDVLRRDGGILRHDGGILRHDGV